MKSRAILLLTAFIWGFAFVAQRQGMESVPPFTFNAIRFLLGAVSLLPFALMQQRRNSSRATANPRSMWLGGMLTGLVLFIAASLQQIGIVDTSAGKAGFITGLYVVIVPLMGLVRGHRAGFWIWFGASASVVGLYLLTVTETWVIARGDAFVLASAFFLALHVQLVDRYSASIGTLRLSLIQFSVVVLCSFVVALGLETVTLDGLRAGLGAILYTGLLSVGVAYTLQVVGQRDTPPAQAAIILSLETVFAALGGWLILGESLPARGLLGCGLMFAGMLASQLGGALSLQRVKAFFNTAP